jgi:hypothetical protein
MLSYAIALAALLGPFRVIDGDTIRAGTDRIRLLGIDAPGDPRNGRCPPYPKPGAICDKARSVASTNSLCAAVTPRMEIERVGQPSRKRSSVRWPQLTGRFSDEDLLAYLRQLSGRHGYFSARTIREDDHAATEALIAARFGSMAKAYERVGIENRRYDVFSRAEPSRAGKAKRKGKKSQISGPNGGAGERSPAKKTSGCSYEVALAQRRIDDACEFNGIAGGIAGRPEEQEGIASNGDSRRFTVAGMGCEKLLRLNACAIEAGR